mmetsp:Transcript_12643/g.19425  ORF Transcript_12643/g.19425 Transcript_12643/m.19425 type:complete len:207 (-) Transcript_12643:625-1245(-)
MPWPPPMQALPRALVTPGPARPVARAWARWAVMRAPEAPSGWPSAMAPPLLLATARSRPSSFSQARYWAAKASLISTSPTSPSDVPAAARAPAMAGTGPMPMISGAQPARPQPASRASGVRLYLATAASLASSTLPAPSLMPEALPAVTHPSFLNTGLRERIFSSWTSGRGLSSAVTSCGPLRPFTSTGASSASNTPALFASPHAI